MPLRYAASIGTGHTPDRSKPEYWEDCTVPWVTASDLSSRHEPFAPLLDTAQYVSEVGLQHSAAVVHPPGTVMLCRTASVGLFVVTGRAMATTQAFVTWTPHDGALDSRYLLYTVAAMAPEWERLAYGSTHKTIYMPDLEGLRIPVPPLDEQRRITDFLDTETARLDAMTAALTLRSRLTTTRTQALRDSLLIPRPISPSGPDWPLVPLKHVASFFTDGDWIESPFIVDAGIRLIQTGNVGIGAYREQGYRYVSEDTFRELRCTEVEPRDVLISRLASPAGRACLAPCLPDRMIASVDVAIFRPTGGLDPAFAVHYMSTSAHLQLADLEARGTTMQRLSRRQLGDLRLPVPRLSEQRRLSEYLDDAVWVAGGLIAANDAQLAVLAERRQALITAAVTGRLDVTTARGGLS